MFTLEHLRRLERQKDSLQETYDLMFEQLTALRQSYAVEMNPGVKAQRKLEIRNAERECSDMETQLSEIEQKIERCKQAFRGDPLYAALLRLNYHTQEVLFRRLIDTSQIGAFLIHGEPGYGQS